MTPDTPSRVLRAPCAPADAGLDLVRRSGSVGSYEVADATASLIINLWLKDEIPENSHLGSSISRTKASAVSVWKLAA